MTSFKPPVQPGASRTLGTFVGVFCPCFVCVVNVLYFLRLPYVIGMGGCTLTLLGLGASFILVMISISSLSLISSNGDIEGGGSYYLISRTIGPGLGGMCGMSLALMSIFAAATAHLGFAETIMDLFHGSKLTGYDWIDMRILSCAATIFVIGTVQFTFEARCTVFFVIAAGLTSYFLGLIFPQVRNNYAVCSNENIRLNLKQNPIETNLDFFYTFSIIFPAFGGILAGSNASGNLKRPRKSIPIGTISALISGILVYFVSTITLSACNHREDQLLQSSLSPIQDSAIYGPLVIAATIASAFGKSYTGLGTGQNTFRFMGIHDILPKIFLNYPKQISCILVCGLCLWGNTNYISSISSNFALQIFIFLNFSTFQAWLAKAPNFRPTFKFSHPIVGLFGAILCVVAAILVDWVVFAICLIFMVWFYDYIYERHMEVNWGSLQESNAYQKGLIAALELKHIPPSPKLFRPNAILLIDGHPSLHKLSVHFLHQLLLRQGLAMVARIFPPSTPLGTIVNDRTTSLVKSKKGHHLFYEAVIASDKKEALLKLMLLTGLGALRPNMCIIEFDESLSEETAVFIGDVMDRCWSIAILRHPKILSEFGNIDLWWFSDDGGLTPLLASILAKRSRTLRVFTLTSAEQSPIETKIGFKKFFKKLRISAEIETIPFSERFSKPSLHIEEAWQRILDKNPDDEAVRSMTRRYMIMADLIRNRSSTSDCVIMTLPVPRLAISGVMYLRWLSLLSDIPPPVLMVRGNGVQAVSWNL